jgi:hypothetical protein
VKTNEAVRDNQRKGNEINVMMLKASYPSIMMISVIKYPVTGVYRSEVINNFYAAGTFGLTKTQLGSRIYEVRSDRPFLSRPKSNKKED